MTKESDSLLPPPPNPANAIISAAIPAPQRRPRNREVRSRFMSPVVPSSSCSSSKSPLPDARCRTQPLSTSTQRRRQLDLDSPSENRSHVSRSLETPFLGAHRRTEGNPLKENAGGGDNGRLIRTDTPVVSSSMDRIMPSRYRQTPSQRSISTRLTPATKLLHSNGMSFSGSPAQINYTASREDPDENSCGNEIDLGKSGEVAMAKLITDVRCSILEGDMLPLMSNSMLVERNGNCETVSKVPKSPHWRLPNSPFQYGSLERPAPGLAKPLVTTMTTGKVCLPPVPPGGKTLTDAKKGKKVSSHQEDVHMLKLLYNHYLQWRFANAKAEASTQSLKEEAERLLFSVCTKIGDMHISVKRKLAELELLRRAGNVSAIVESQMPYLDEWSAIEGDYLTSISEAIQALSNVALQLPMSGIARADVKEVSDVLFTAMRVMDPITSHIEKFSSKAQVLEVYLSELAKATSVEKVGLEECGGLLSAAYVSQVRECSLRSQIIQSHRHQSLLIQCLEDMEFGIG